MGDCDIEKVELVLGFCLVSEFNVGVLVVNIIFK